jgi:hypothetical protein
VTDPYVVGIPFGVAVIIVYTVVYALSHRQHRVAWTVTLISALVTWSVIAYLVVPNTRASPLCVPLQSIPESSCPQGPHGPTVLGYVAGYLVILGVAFVSRPRKSE